MTIHVDDEQRRARLARRHALHPAHRRPDVDSAARAMTVLHATEAASVHLALQARVDDVTLDQVDDALYERRSLVKQLAMRRTLFVFPRDLLPAALGSISGRVAGAELRRLAQDVERAGHATDGATWVQSAVDAVVATLADGEPLDVATLRDRIPVLQTRVVQGSGRWAQEQPVAARVTTTAGAQGSVVRGPSGPDWRQSRPRWTSMQTWLGHPAEPVEPAAGYAELVRRWLRTFGPGTEDDIVWWLGSTKAAVRQALLDVEAVAVDLDTGDTGYLLPDDLEPVDPVDDWAALLPVLDPTAMGWKQRAFYFDADDVPYLMDRAGNIGTTAWWNGRIVGCWVQDDDGRVSVRTRHDLPPRARDLLEEQADRLTAWLDGAVVNSIYRSAQMKGEPIR